MSKVLAAAIALWIIPYSVLGLSIDPSFQIIIKPIWQYVPLAVETNTSHPEMLKWDLTVERISRGEFAISGTFQIAYDITEATMIEIVSQRSGSGQSDDFKFLPLTLPKQSFYNFLNTDYKLLVMNSLKDCSDMPVFKGKFVPPMPQKVYHLNRCSIAPDRLPLYVAPGFYKIIILFSGEINSMIAITTKVEHDF